MVKLVHNIEISVFEKEEQILNSIYETFNKILPVDFKKEKNEIQKTKAEGFNHEIIHITSLKIQKYKHSLLLLQNIFKKLEAANKLERISQQECEIMEARTLAKNTNTHQEDALHAILARRAGAKCLITRNLKDFEDLSLIIESKLPEDL